MPTNHFTPAERTRNGRLGALVQQSRNDPKAYTGPARRAFLAKFVIAAAEDYPDLPEAEVVRRAEAALKAHMTRLAIRSAAARRARKVRAA
jgi:hypothetical protein